MRVMIDCRKALDFGIGRYIRGLVSGFHIAAADTEFLLVGSPDARESMTLPPNSRWIENDSRNYSLAELWTIGRLADRERADVLHSPHYVTPRSRVPIVVTIHDLIHLHQPLRNPLARLYAKWMLRRAARRSAAVIAVSNCVASEIVNELAAPREKVFVVPNGIDQRFVSTPRTREAREPFVLFVGNDKPHKNLTRLVRAFEESNAGVELWVAGGGGGARVSGRGVRILGFVPDEKLAELYRSATAVVAPSLEEGFCLPAVEALAAGTPVIASDLAVLREVTEGNALFFDPRSTEAIGEALREVLKPETWGRLSRQGPHAVESLRWEAAAKKTLAIYQTVSQSVTRTKPRGVPGMR